LYVAQNPIVFTRVVVETGEVVRPGSGDREPTIQVHRVDEHTFVLRRNKTVDYEAPFRFLYGHGDHIAGGRRPRRGMRMRDPPNGRYDRLAHRRSLCPATRCHMG